MLKITLALASELVYQASEILPIQCWTLESASGMSLSCLLHQVTKLMLNPANMSATVDVIP